MRAIPIVSSLVAVGLLFSAGCEKVAPKKAPQEAVPVEVKAVEQKDLPIEIPTVGAVEPIATVQLKAKVRGEVAKVGFADGSSVKEGQILFEIDPRSYQASLDRTKADLAVAEAQLQNSEDLLKRYSALSNKGAASEEQYAQFVSNSRQREAEVNSKKADVASAQLLLDWATVKSPIDGRAGAVLVKQGNIVQAETQVLTIINQLHPIYVAFSVPEAQLVELRKRQSDGPLAVQARNPSTEELIDEGTLTFIDNSVDTGSGMIAIRATFPNERDLLWPGQFVDVVVQLGVEKKALIVPTVAILESQRGPKVFVVKNGVAELRDVKIRRTFGDNTVIDSGLSVGEDVIFNGQLRVKNGAKVSVSQSQPTPSAPAP